MKKLMLSAFALAMMTTGTMAGEQLTTAQLDQVTAGGWGDQFAFASVRQTNKNSTRQKADGGCNGFAVCAGFDNGNASNYNATYQSNHAINAAVNVD